MFSFLYMSLLKAGYFAINFLGISALSYAAIWLLFKAFVIAKVLIEYLFQKRKERGDLTTGIMSHNFSLFDYFANEHGIDLLESELDDIKHVIYREIENDLTVFTPESLDNLFHKVIEEMNRRKAEEQNVDVGFWNSEGEYKEDIQKIDETDEWIEKEV